MPLVKHVLGFLAFGKKGSMTPPEDIQPTDIVRHRYQDHAVLRAYLETLFVGREDEITISVFPTLCG